MVLDMDSAIPLAQSIFFNISFLFSIKKCKPNENYVEKSEEEFEESDLETGLFHYLQSQTEPVQNQTVWESFFGLFSPFEDSESPELNQVLPEKIVSNVDTTSPYLCDTVILATQQESFYAEILLQWLVAAVFMFFVILISSCFLFCSWKRQNKSKKRKSRITTKAPVETNDSKESKIEEVTFGSSEEQAYSDEVTPAPSEVTEMFFPKKVLSSPIQLSSGRFHSSSDLFKCSKVDVFLEHTVDKFLANLDKKLDIGFSSESYSSSPGFGAVSSYSSATIPTSSMTPKITRRSTSCVIRRARQNVASMPLGNTSLLDRNSIQGAAWYELEAMNSRMNWSHQNFTLRVPDLNDILEPRLRNVLQSHQSTCPLKNEQLSSVVFMVNYVLLLLEKELSTLVSEDGFKLVRFKSFGSMQKGTKICKASHFDVLMVLSCDKISLDKAYYHNNSDDISPGSTLITAREVKQNVRKRKMLKRAFIDDDFHQVISPGETMINASELLDRAITNLMTKGKKYIDRLPFTVGRSSTKELTILLNTRLLHGLGLGITEVSIKLLPALPLQYTPSLLLPKLYAVVPRHLQNCNVKKATTPNQGLRIFRRPDNLDKDLLWDLCYCELESQYLQDMTNMLETSGIQPCFLVCLSVLKTLFSNSNRTSLLNRGEIEPYHLETILYFLLLESTPAHWSFENLPCRLSDAVHFLRSAVSSQWLPNFFVANPHLMKKCPALEHIPFLNCNRQVNLFSNMSTDVMRKTQNFIKTRLTETGISAALKEEYSHDMWEYEFFIFG